MVVWLCGLGCWLVGGLVGLLVGWLIGRVAGWLVGWLVFSFIEYLYHPVYDCSLHRVEFVYGCGHLFQVFPFLDPFQLFVHCFPLLLLIHFRVFVRLRLLLVCLR